MTKSAREVIAAACTKTFGARWGEEKIIEALSQAGYVILPKEPSEGMIEAGVHGWGRPTTFEKQARDIYRAMITHAEGEKG